MRILCNGSPGKEKIWMRNKTCRESNSASLSTFVTTLA
jgi:hypothetical protein